MWDTPSYTMATFGLGTDYGLLHWKTMWSLLLWGEMLLCQTQLSVRVVNISFLLLAWVLHPGVYHELNILTKRTVGLPAIVNSSYRHMVHRLSKALSMLCSKSIPKWKLALATSLATRWGLLRALWKSLSMCWSLETHHFTLPTPKGMKLNLTAN